MGGSPQGGGTSSGEAQHPHRGEQHPTQAPAKDSPREATRTAKAGRRARARHHRRPTHRETQRKRGRPTKPPTKSNQDDRRARRRNGGKRQPHAQKAGAQPTRGHATPPARTNRRHATTRSSEPRQPPRGTGKGPKRTNRPRNKATKKKDTNKPPQPRRKPPQPRKKPPQPQNRHPRNEAKTPPKRRRPGTRPTPPEHPLYLNFPDRRDKHGAEETKIARRRPPESGTQAGTLVEVKWREERPRLLPRRRP